MKLLTHDELGALGNYLRAAAERYTEHAATCRAATDMREDAREAMAKQFERQKEDAIAFADKLDNLPHVLMGTCTRCANEEEHEPGSLCSDRHLVLFIRDHRLE